MNKLLMTEVLSLDWTPRLLKLKLIKRGWVDSTGLEKVAKLFGETTILIFQEDQLSQVWSYHEDRLTLVSSRDL